MPFPVHIIHKLSEWHRINLLKSSGDVSIINQILPFSDRPDDVARLLHLIKNHYGFELFRAIDNAKRTLSEQELAIVRFRQLDLTEEISVAEFENMIGDIVSEIEKTIAESLKTASVTSARIDRVLLTGGTSQVPLINDIVVKIFGEEKISRPGFFSSVATGLGHMASLLK